MEKVKKNAFIPVSPLALTSACAAAQSIIGMVWSPFGEYGWMKFTCISSLRSLSRCVSVRAFAYKSVFVWTSYWSPVTESPQRRMRHPDEVVRKEKINGGESWCRERGLTRTVIQIMGRRRWRRSAAPFKKKKKKQELPFTSTNARQEHSCFILALYLPNISSCPSSNLAGKCWMAVNFSALLFCWCLTPMFCQPALDIVSRFRRLQKF